MSQVFNQYSYLFLSAALLLALLIVLRWRHVRWRIVFGTLFLAAVLLGGIWTVVRQSGGTVETLASAEATLKNGRPTFVEFFSQYCLGCVSARPQVETMVSQIKDDFNILLVDIHTDFGRALRQKLGFSYSPEFVLFNARGEEVWRSNRPPTTDQLALATS